MTQHYKKAGSLSKVTGQQRVSPGFEAREGANTLFYRYHTLLSREPDGHIAHSAVGCTAWPQHLHSDTNELTTCR